jgi:hypothetical protein
MVNAFTSMPSSEQVARVSNAFGPMEGSPAMPAAPGYPQQGGPMSMPMPSAGGVVRAGYQGSALATGGSMVDPQAMQQMMAKTMATLRDALYPSQRECAAETLATVDWRAHPYVVGALVTAAREDPAATVRADCVRCLARMNVNTTPVITTIQGLRTDTDPRVRQEADQALTILAPSK